MRNLSYICKTPSHLPYNITQSWGAVKSHHIYKIYLYSQRGDCTGYICKRVRLWGLSYNFICKKLPISTQMNSDQFHSLMLNHLKHNYYHFVPLNYFSFPLLLILKKKNFFLKGLAGSLAEPSSPVMSSTTFFDSRNVNQTDFSLDPLFFNVPSSQRAFCIPWCVYLDLSSVLFHLVILTHSTDLT